MDKIIVYDNKGNEQEMEVCIISEMNDKRFVIYRDLEKQNYYASYYKIINGEIMPTLYNDITDEEYKMLMKLYQKGVMQDV